MSRTRFILTPCELMIIKNLPVEGGMYREKNELLDAITVSARKRIAMILDDALLGKVLRLCGGWCRNDGFQEGMRNAFGRSILLLFARHVEKEEDLIG